MRKFMPLYLAFILLLPAFVYSGEPTEVHSITITIYNHHMLGTDSDFFHEFLLALDSGVLITKLEETRNSVTYLVRKVQKLKGNVIHESEINTLTLSIPGAIVYSNPVVLESDQRNILNKE